VGIGTAAMQSWKASGPDGVQGYWMKVFPGMSTEIGKAMWKTIKHPQKIEQWLVAGRTVLIPKEGCKGKPHQYSLIICLNIMSKLTVGVIKSIHFVF